MLDHTAPALRPLRPGLSDLRRRHDQLFRQILRLQAELEDLSRQIDEAEYGPSPYEVRPC